MAAPTGTTALWDTVIIELNSPGGITSNSPGTLVGTVRQIGLQVNRVSVGDQVLFRQDSPSGVFSQSSTSWVAVSQTRILLIFTSP